MIKENRWNHILGVARKSKEFAAKFQPENIKFIEDMFLLGILHDIGYEFMETNEDHAMIGGEILKRSYYKYWKEVSLHGDINVDMSDELFILNCADMTTGPNGENFNFEERLEEISNRLGNDSNAYKKCVIMVEKLKKDARYKKYIG